MCQNFLKIPAAEQERITNICLEEFAGKGYERASTNIIVEKAGIPKGTLFYYFGSKKKMFLFLLDKAIQRYSELYRELEKNKPSDLFERLLYQAKIKIHLAKQEPLLYQFFLKIFLDIPPEIDREMQQRFKTYSAAVGGSLKEGLDLSLFKDEVNVNRVVEMINLLLDGLLVRYSEKFKGSQPEQTLEIVQQLESQITDYFEMIKMGVYLKN
jgi:AcrR family transcriptional regulator